MPPVTVSVHRLSAGFSAANLRSMRGPSALRAMRTSTSAQASAGITLLLVPPPTTPTFTVRPRLRSVQPLTVSTTRASSRMALAPFSKSTPAWAATPFTSIRQYAGALARGLAGQPLRRLQHVDGGALGRQPLGDGPRDRAAHLLVAVQQQHDLPLQQTGFGRASRWRSRPWPRRPSCPACPAPTAGLRSAGRAWSSACPAAKPYPDGPAAEALRASIFRAPACLDLWPEARLQHIAKRALAVQLHAPAQGPGVRGSQRNAGIHGGLVVGGRLGPHQFAGSGRAAQAPCAGPRPAGRAWGWEDRERWASVNLSGGYSSAVAGHSLILRRLEQASRTPDFRDRKGGLTGA